MQFQGTDKYVATDDLKMAVNASIALKRPLLIKGSRAPARPCSPSRLPSR